jgi:hypothetical protein
MRRIDQSVLFSHLPEHLDRLSDVGHFCGFSWRLGWLGEGGVGRKGEHFLATQESGN